MTLIIETGAGVQDANSYVSTSYIDTYLTERDRGTENGWDTATAPQKEAALIKATQYIDHRFGGRFKGTKLTTFSGRYSEGIVEFSGLPSDTETIIIGNTTYTFVTTLSTLTSQNQVLIAADAAGMAANLVSAITRDGSTGVYSDNVLINQDATAMVNSDVDTTIELTARQAGTSGDDIVLSTAATNVTVTGMLNGVDYGSQRLEFPRAGLFDRSGKQVLGIPQQLKWATCEYAIRANDAELWFDPVIDASGRSVTAEKIGPIETVFSEGAAINNPVKPYPAADYLLSAYLKPAGVVR